ncbi:MAG TPA: hypothetical protein VI670_26195 [Thermoanaerobaculia bacterium]|jgi:hypothetical protein
MKKFIVLMAVLLVATSAFAGFKPAPNATFNNGLLPTSTNNDDTCDIASNAPAATLLLPYFEVDFKSPQTTARTTLFTIVNTSDLPQIAHVVVWTDWSFPALDFNIFLTGYDVQGINLYDIFARATIAPGATPGTGGTSSNTDVPTNPQNGLPGSNPGTQPADNDANPNITSLSGCANLPGVFSSTLLTDLQLIFTTGKGTGAAVPCTAQVGGVHANAIGYVTIDVAPTCHTSLPNEPGYFSLILFDNVLIGDYQDINPNPATGNFAGGNPLVPIRAVPEGGPAGSVPGTNLPFTFYDRYTAGGIRTIDRRQPLPTVWAARFINGGTGAFNTNFKIWREGITIGACSGAGVAAISNSNLAIREVVRFDEHENATITNAPGGVSPAPPGAPGIPETGAYSAANTTLFPPLSNSGDVGGWMYFNLNNGGSTNYSAARAGFAINNTTVRPSQNWVIVSMFAEGRFSVDFDAAWLGNGCSAPVPLTSAAAPGSLIGPVGGVPVCPAGVVCTPASAYIGTNQTP